MAGNLREKKGITEIHQLHIPTEPGPTFQSKNEDRMLGSAATSACPVLRKISTYILACHQSSDVS